MSRHLAVRPVRPRRLRGRCRGFAVAVVTVFVFMVARRSLRPRSIRMSRVTPAKACWSSIREARLSSLSPTRSAIQFCHTATRPLPPAGGAAPVRAWRTIKPRIGKARPRGSLCRHSRACGSALHACHLYCGQYRPCRVRLKPRIGRFQRLGTRRAHRFHRVQDGLPMRCHDEPIAGRNCRIGRAHFAGRLAQGRAPDAARARKLFRLGVSEPNVTVSSISPRLTHGLRQGV